MNLEGSTASLLEQFPDGTRSDLQREERNLERFGSIAFRGLGVVGGLGVIAMIYVIITEMVLSGTKPLAGIFFAAFLIFAALTLTYVIWRESLKEKRQKLERTPGLDAVPPADTARLLDAPAFEPVPSVVEDTTELLDVSENIRN